MLLKEVGLRFSVVPSHADESFPGDMDVALVPALLARRKAEAIYVDHKESLVLASDTVVILGSNILNKPVDRADAIRMLTMLSGVTHTVITAVYLKGPGVAIPFEDITRVTFRKLGASSIEKYVDDFKPFDKAGAYGAQECLPTHLNPCSRSEQEFLRFIGKDDLVKRSMSNPAGMARVDAIEKIDGSFFTVMGLPVHLVFHHLLPYRA